MPRRMFAIGHTLFRFRNKNQIFFRDGERVLIYVDFSPGLRGEAHRYFPGESYRDLGGPPCRGPDILRFPACS